jgi:hypothetical protein
MTIETVPWEAFKANHFRWRQGEHVAAIAPTGAGKTTLMRALLDYRGYSIYFGTKPDDKLYRDIMRDGFKRVESIDEIKPWDNRIILWPRQRRTINETMRAQQSAFRDAMDMIVNQKSWTAWFDECKYMSQQLKLANELTYCLEQLRSIGGTTISGAQRPVWLPRSVLSNASHVFLWRTNDREDARRLADIGGIDARAVAEEAKTLGKHEFIYLYARGVETHMIRSQVGR